MTLLLVQHRDGDAWVDSVREDLIDHGGEHVLALFYTLPETEAFITAMCGLMHCGGNPDDFRVIEVVDDGTPNLKQAPDLAECGVCGLNKPVCCDDGYTDNEDGSRTHVGAVCVECCTSNIHRRGAIWDGKSVAGGTYERGE